MKLLIKSMKVLAVVGLMAGPALADSDTAGQKVDKAGHDIRREARKGANRIDEDFCTGTKAECAGRRVKHRAQEAGDKVKDKTNEAIDKAK